MRLSLKSNSPARTKEIGATLGNQLSGGEVIGLRGDLGSGKTTFVQGLARGLGIGRDEYVRSPTFTLINEYGGRIPLYHFDLYRLSGQEDMENIGYEEYFWSKGVCVIEWYEKIKEAMPKEIISLNILMEKGNERKLDFSSNGIYYRQILKSFKKNIGE